MALVLADRVLETTTTAGSGTITLAGAEPGYQSFSAVGDGNQTYYTITEDTDWEVGIGTYTASGTTLSRDTVLSSSASGAKVTFSAGVKKVFVTYPSEKSVNLDVSGNISLSSAVISGVAYPTVNSDAATKLYVDTMVASGITYHEPVKYEVPNSTGNLVATYNNGTAGVSATLTNAGSLVPFIPDGVTATISDRVLVYNQSNAYENGVYVVSTVGNGSTAWVLTRATDADTYGVKSPTSLGQGDAFFVTSGDTGAGETYICNNSGVISFGSTAISFVQISSAQVYKAGVGISLTGTTISLVSPVAVATGGTGTTATPTNGQLLIGNGTNYTLSTLTAGSGVSITNSAGSITLSATGLGGTVTAVTATGPLASSGGTTPDISIANTTGTGSVVLENSPSIFSATITAALSASITTITGSSANITTVTGTTTTFSSGTISQLGATSATITTLSGTNVTYSSGTVSQLAATSATIANISGTNVTYSNGNFTSATVSTISGTTATYTSATVTNLALTSITLSNISVASATITTGNLAFTGTAQRITGDMTNATLSNRLMFQNSVTNATSNIQVMPSGTGGTAGLLAFAASDPANTNFAAFQAVGGGNETRINSGITGTGTYAPITFYTGGSERMRLDTSGNLGIGTASPGEKLAVVGNIVAGNTGSTSDGYIDIDSGGAGKVRITRTGTGATDSSMVFSTTFSTLQERMRITSGGNVGIGTTNATFKLVAANSGTDGGWMYSSAAISILGLGGYANAGDGAFQIQYNRGTGAITFNGGTRDTPSARISIDNGGNVTIPNLGSTSANITTLTGTTFGTTATTQLRANSLAISTTGARFDSAGDIYAIRSGGTTGVIFLGNSGLRYLFYDGSQYYLPGANLSINGALAVTANGGTYNITSNYANNLTQGFNNNWNTDFAAAPAGSTILRGDTATGSATGGPGGTWWFQQNMRHNNGTNVWGVQVAWGWEDNANILRTRNVQGGGYGAWVTYLNSANYTSYITGSSLKSQTFTGSGTFTVPAGITSVWVTMVGGGGSGGSNAQSSGAGGGGGGAYCLKRAVSVTPGAGVAVTIGGGGGGVNNSDGNDGGASSFGSVSVSGGIGGLGQSTFSMGGAGGGNGGVGIGTNNASGRQPYPATGPGGRGGKSDTTTYWGSFSGGGGGLFGDGTNGSNNNSASAGANTGAGSGGASNGAWSSGNGGSGMVIVEWLG